MNIKFFNEVSCKWESNNPWLLIRHNNESEDRFQYTMHSTLNILWVQNLHHTEYFSLLLFSFLTFCAFCVSLLIVQNHYSALKFSHASRAYIVKAPHHTMRACLRHICSWSRWSVYECNSQMYECITYIYLNNFDNEAFAVLLKNAFNFLFVRTNGVVVGGFN